MDDNTVRCWIEGKTYDQKEEIKSIKNSKGEQIFRWQADDKSWVAAAVPDQAIDRLAEILAAKCPGLTLRVETGGGGGIAEPEEEIPF